MQSDQAQGLRLYSGFLDGTRSREELSDVRIFKCAFCTIIVFALRSLTPQSKNLNERTTKKI